MSALVRAASSTPSSCATRANAWGGYYGFKRYFGCSVFEVLTFLWYSYEIIGVVRVISVIWIITIMIVRVITANRVIISLRKSKVCGLGSLSASLLKTLDSPTTQ